MNTKITNADIKKTVANFVARLDDNFKNVHPIIARTFAPDIHPDYTKLPIISENNEHTVRKSYKGELNHINPYVLGLQSHTSGNIDKIRSPSLCFLHDTNSGDYLQQFFYMFEEGIAERAAIIKKKQESARVEQFKTDIKRLNIKTGDTLYFHADKTSTEDPIQVQVAYVTRSKNAAALINLEDKKNNTLFPNSDGADHIFVAGQNGIMGTFSHLKVSPSIYSLATNN